MATSKTLTPTNQTISIPELSDAPDMSVASDAISKEADAINTLNEQLALQDLSSTGITRETILGSGGSLYLYRIGKIVILTFANIGVSSAITTTDTKIATLSVPAVRNVFSIAKSINNDDVFFFVNTSGGLYISGITGAPANKALYGTIVYFTN